MKRFLALIMLLFMPLFCGFLFSCNNESESQQQSEEIPPFCEVSILKIGKADCIIINTGSKILMIDTGETENLADIHSFMREREWDKIDTLILTHPDKDHIGGASEIISHYGIKTVIEGAYAPLTEEYVLYHATLEEMGIEPIILNGAYSFKLDGCEIEIDAPRKQKYASKQSNNSSLVVSLTCGERRFLFCGDAMELRLSELIEAEIGAYDFVKLPYHGNYLENYREFLDMVRCQYGAITCSGKNPASPDTLALLDEYGIEVFQTRHGTIRLSCDGAKITIEN
ncbi:MAG: MBL fold metallo-hydrolase [Clostridia bacterium]|nr:MBL fold metallo-hydrolase [Clostridia bacterium]